MPEPREAVDSRLRDYLHAELHDQVAKWEANAIRDGEVKFAKYIRKCWQPMIDALYEGKAVLVNRYELPWEDPYEHPQSTKFGGHPFDLFELGEDDVLRPSDGPPAKLSFRPNRKQRRAAGFRGPVNGEPTVP